MGGQQGQPLKIFQQYSPRILHRVDLMLGCLYPEMIPVHLIEVKSHMRSAGFNIENSVLAILFQQF